MNNYEEIWWVWIQCNREATKIKSHYISDEEMMVWLLAWCIPMNVWTKNFKKMDFCKYLLYMIPSICVYITALMLDTFINFDGTTFPPPLQCFPEVDHGRMGDRRIYYSETSHGKIGSFGLGLTYCGWRENCQPGRRWFLILRKLLIKSWI